MRHRPTGHPSHVTSIRLRGPGDLLATLPYQLGFHPQDSVVLVAVTGGRVAFLQRVDLPPRRHVPVVVEAILRPVARFRPDGVFLVGYETVEGSSHPLLSAMAAECKRVAVEARGVWVVRDGRWYAGPGQHHSGPPRGIPMPKSSDVPAVADFVALERGALPTREALGTQLEPDVPRRRAVARACRSQNTAHDRSTKGEARPGECDHHDALRLWATVLSVGDGSPSLETMTDPQLATLVLSLRDVHLRDAVIAWMCPGSMPITSLPGVLPELVPTLLPEPSWGLTAAMPGGASRDLAHLSEPLGVPADAMPQVSAAQRLESRLQWLCRVTPRRDLPAMLTVLANFAWWRGDGAMARTALERALRLDPDYRLAVLLEQMLSLALRPGATA